MTHATEIRRLAARDSIDALTALLHRAYAPLAAAGWNFAAATQDASTTARRAAEGQCFVAVHDGRLAGTVTVCGPYQPGAMPPGADVPAFRDRDTAHLHQFAVDPALQRRGIGRLLVNACEQWATDHGYKRMALDVPEPAEALRAMYRRLGYAEVSMVRWEGRTYRSAILERALDRSPVRDQLRLLARYDLWATRRLYEHVDALPEALYRRDAGLFFGSVHGTLNHLLVAEHALWFRRFAEGVSPRIALDTTLEDDRAALRERLIDGALQWLALIAVWPADRLLGNLDFVRSDGEALSLPFVPTLMHVFNHGTHHRGQITAALTAMGRPCPALDLLVLLREEAGQP